MADKAKAELKITYSENTNFTDPQWITNWDNYEVDPDEGETRTVQADTGGGSTVTTSQYSAVTLLAVKNTDTSNLATATFRTAGNSTTDNIIQIPAGGLLVISDYTPANNLVLVATGAAVTCKVAVVGT